jgi:hypothetical protein
MSGSNIVGFYVLCVFPIGALDTIFEGRSSSFEFILAGNHVFFDSFDSTHSTTHTSTTECVESSYKVWRG